MIIGRDREGGNPFEKGNQNQNYKVTQSGSDF